MISKHHNNEFDAVSPNGVPNAAGDRYFGQDLFRDFCYLMDRLGLSFKDIIKHIPFRAEGGAVSQGTGATLNITLGFGYAKFSVQTVLSYGATPPSTQDEDIEAIRVAWTAQTDMALPSYTAGGAINYVKVAYTELDGTTRARAKKAGSYAYEQSPSYAFTVDTTPPTDYELCIKTFTEAAGTFTFSEYLPFLKATHQAGNLMPVRNLLVSNWTERANTKNVTLYSIIWSPSLGLFCAVGINDGVDAYIVTSPDGIVWTERAPAVAKNIALRGVCWSPDLNLFCAVGVADGVDGYLLTSPDGTTWTERNNPQNRTLYAITWSEELTLFCAVGINDGVDAYIVTSPDGTTWTDRANAQNKALRGICWSPDLTLFCAVGLFDGVDAYIVTSPDGTTWTDRANPKSFPLFGVCWSPDLALFCAVGGADGTDGYLLTSPDGTTWTERNNSRNLDLNSVFWSPDLKVFCAVGETNGTYAYILTSPDGIHWTERVNPKAFDLFGACWSPKLSLFCAIGAVDGSDAYMVTSLLT
jgi:WD40 repeat protein